MPIPLGILAVAGAGAGGAGAFDLLETTLISTNTASVTFSNLNNYSNYKHLQLRVVARSSRTAFDSDELRFRYNSNTGSNYSFHRLTGNGSSVTSGGFSPDTSGDFSNVATNLSPSNVFGAVVADILDFSSTSKNTTIRLLGGYNSNTTSQVELNSGGFLLTNAITSIQIYAGSGDLVSGSRFSLYGIK